MTSRRLWVPLLVALLVAVLVGPTVVSAVEPRVTRRTVMIPAAAFTPADDGADFVNDGSILWVNTGTAHFVAPVSFDAPEVTVRKIVLYAYDDLAADGICVQMGRSAPATGSLEIVGTLCSTGADDMPRAFTLTTLTYRRVTGAHGAYLFLTMPSSLSSYKFFGVKITYTY